MKFSSLAVAIGIGATIAAANAVPAAAAISKISLATYRTEVNPLITAITAADIVAARTFGSYTGVGSIFISYASTKSTGFGALCTGALTSSRTVLTAGHCLSNYTEDGTYDPVKSITFYLPSRGERTPALTFVGDNQVVNPNFDPTAAFAGSDLAQFQLRSSAPTSGYQLYTAQDDSEIGSVFTRVGTGTTGDKKGTSAGPFDFDQRAGVNLYELNGSDLFSDVPSTVLLSDFDDGTAAHDVFGNLAQYGPPFYHQTGLRNATGKLIETNSSPGDSGGPEFIDGKIAGVTSFGVTGAVIDGGCGRGYIDPYFSATGSCTNSSVGEISGDTQVSAFLPFINNYIAAVPEPTSWALFIAGFGVVGALQRRRRRGYATA